MTAPRFYRVRLAKGAAWSAVKVWYGPPLDPIDGSELDRGHRWQAEVNGAMVDPDTIIINHDPASTSPPIINGEECDEREYNYLLSVNRWAVDNDPMAPEAAPRSRIDFNKLAAIKF